jgi:hypothetical protein
MPQRLPPVLSGLDLPLAELHAARLDGEVFRVDDCFSPIDEIAQPAHRARALVTGVRDRLIAEQRSAAWVWGALSEPPTVHQFCVVLGARVTPPGISWMTVREVVLDASELVTLEGLQVTTPLRTAVDLARFTVEFGPAEGTMVTGLMRVGRFGLAECLDDMDRRRNLPNKRRAARFLRECVG